MLNNGKHGQGTHCTKMGADMLAENTVNDPGFICPCPKVLDFNEKRLHWAFIVCDWCDDKNSADISSKFQKAEKIPSQPKSWEESY